MVMNFRETLARANRLLLGSLMLSTRVTLSLGFMASPAPVLLQGQARTGFLPSPAAYSHATRESSWISSEEARTGSAKVGISEPSKTRQATRRLLLLPIISTPLPETYHHGAPSIALEPTPRLVFTESMTRSAVKALAWRLTAGVVTLVSCLMFSGSWLTAMGVVGSDFFTKSCAVFFEESWWSKVEWGQSMTGNRAERSLAKVLTWRLFAASNTLVCGVFFVGDINAALKIAGMDTALKTVLFLLGEPMWNNIRWDKAFEPEEFIYR